VILINATKMPAEYTLGTDVDGRERVVVIVKGTFVIPDSPSPARLADTQLPLAMTDVFTGEAATSATLYEADFATSKPCCDVLLNGNAYAPAGRRARTVRVTLRVGNMAKSFDVVGRRVWKKSFLRVRPGRPEAFTRLPISYDGAYGGVDVSPKDPEKVSAYAKNPVGVGFYPFRRNKNLIGRALPVTQEIGNRVRKRSGKYQPMSFGPIGRTFEERLSHAGTYDQKWIDDTFPFLPADFNPLYFQCAPRDQQIDYPGGGEWVELVNLTPNNYVQFQLPRIDVPVEFTNENNERATIKAVIDTILIEPDAGRFTMVWRTSLPLVRNIFELKQAVVGRMTRAWYRARDLGKDYYPSINALVAARAEED
jgi:hypothetical protein